MKGNIFDKIRKASNKYIEYMIACDCVAKEAQKHIDWDNNVSCEYYPSDGICIMIDEHVCYANTFFNGSHKSIEEGRAIITSYGNLYGVIYDIDTVTKRGRIDCGTNEELFLAIAALRNDTDKNQWLTDGDKWILCPEIKFSTYWVYNDIDVNIDTVHKATVDELIEYFKGKEE